MQVASWSRWWSRLLDEHTVLRRAENWPPGEQTRDKKGLRCHKSDGGQFRGFVSVSTTITLDKNNSFPIVKNLGTALPLPGPSIKLKYWYYHDWWSVMMSRNGGSGPNHPIDSTQGDHDYYLYREESDVDQRGTCFSNDAQNFVKCPVRHRPTSQTLPTAHNFTSNHQFL